jgi:hypothetical protein
MPQYTLQIFVQNPAALDGTTLLNIDGPGVTVDKSADRTIIVTLPPSVPFGRLNLGQVAESQIPRLAGRPLILISFTAISAAGAYPAAGNFLRRVTPIVGAQEAIQDLINLGAAPIQGMLFGQPEIFPYAHETAVITTIGGPHRLVFVIKDLDDESVSAWGCCEECDCPTGPTGPTGCCPPQVLDYNGPDLPQGPSVTFSLPGTGLEGPMTGEVRLDTRTPGQVGLPTVNSITVVPGVAPTPDQIEVDLDTDGADGDFMLILTNECDCSTVTPFTVVTA